MHPQVEKVVQTENGPRNVLEGTFKGTKIEVVTGYDITHDRWPFHVYLTPSGGQKSRLSEVPTQYRASTLQAAFDQGMELAVRQIDPPEAGFQREVKI